MRHELRLNAFAMNCVGHQSQGLWRHPRDRSVEYRRLDHWVELARLLERGKFDALFLADVLGVYDVYGSSVDSALREAVQIPVNDPLLIIPSMAQVTEHLGFAVTCNVSHEAPLPFARRMSTLDHLTEGRIGWNIVTGYLDSGAKAAGKTKQIAHDIRYDIAEDFMAFQYGFWEGSWEDDAVLRDRDTGVFTDPAKVHRVIHDGEYFRVDSIHLCEPSPQRTPVLYQAGASSKGLAFAAWHAECVFALVTVITAPTECEAQAKFEDYRRYVSAAGALTLASGWTGIDFSKPDVVAASATGINAIQSAAAAFALGARGDHSSLQRIAETVGLGGGGPTLVGAPERIADELEAWATEADLDGFNLAYAMMPETFSDVVEHLVPELQRRGRFKKSYRPGTYRHKLFGQGPRLGESHPAARHRCAIDTFAG